MYYVLAFSWCFNKNGGPCHQNSPTTCRKICRGLPSATTVKEIVIEAGIVSKLQLSEILPLTEFNALHTDGTTKYGEKYGAFEVSTTEGSYSLALCEMKSGSSTESLDVLNTIIEEIDEISESARLDAAGRKIIITIKKHNVQSLLCREKV